MSALANSSRRTRAESPSGPAAAQKQLAGIVLAEVAVVHHGVSRLTANSSSYDEAFSRNIGWVTLAAETAPGTSSSRQRPPQSIDGGVAAGRAIQRFWLTATGLGLWHQPEVTPLIFSSYLRHGIRFACDQAVARSAAALLPGQAHMLGDDSGHAVWMGRIGSGAAPRSPSTRLPLERLLVQAA